MDKRLLELVDEKESELKLMIEKIESLNDSIYQKNLIETYNILKSRLLEVSNESNYFEFTDTSRGELQEVEMSIKLGGKPHGKVVVLLREEDDGLYITASFRESPKLEHQQLFNLYPNDKNIVTANLIDDEQFLINEEKPADKKFLELIVIKLLDKIIKHYS